MMGGGRLCRRFIINSFGVNRDIVNHLHRFVSRFWPGTALDAGSVPDAIEQVLSQLQPDDRVRSIQFWGHGRPGAINVGDEELKAESFAQDHPHRVVLTQLRERLARGALVAFKGCQTFAGPEGKNLARVAAAFFGDSIVVLGQTRLLGYNLDWGGAVILSCGEEPTWADVDPRNKALKKAGDRIVNRLAQSLRRSGTALREKL
jgi:hypothetical protein